jgi:quinohemoprotein ethanol dehydrogenase
MPKTPKLILAAIACAALTLTTWLGAQQPRQISDDVLKTAEQRYSPAFQVDATNVGRLGLAWTMDIPSAGGNNTTRHEGTALMSNGVLYSIGPWSVVYAVDARTGKEIWHQNPDVDQQVWQSRICCGVVNRGIALYENTVIAPVVDGRLRAYDQATGRAFHPTTCRIRSLWLRA